MATLPKPAANSENSAVPDNLKPYCFKPGQSGNPSGRPKGLVGNALWDALHKDGELADVIAGILKSCKKGNPKAFAVVRDSVDGRPSQTLDINAQVTVSLADRLEAARKAIQSSDVTDE